MAWYFVRYPIFIWNTFCIWKINLNVNRVLLRTRFLEYLDTNSNVIQIRYVSPFAVCTWLVVEIRWKSSSFSVHIFVIVIVIIIIVVIVVVVYVDILKDRNWIVNIAPRNWASSFVCFKDKIERTILNGCYMIQ